MKKEIVVYAFISLIVILIIGVSINGFAFIRVPISSCSDSDGGMDYYEYGEIDNYADYCVSTSSLKEYYCSGDSMSYTTYDCEFGCEGGVCISSSCSLNECNLVQDKWCDQAPNWESYGYTESCEFKDYSLNSTYCEGNVCDYVNHKYCSGNQWFSGYYCDVSYCGTNVYSQDYCACDYSGIEVCDNYQDDDCDGYVDCKDTECSCDCSEGETKSCGSEEGVCTIGVQVCEGGGWGDCSGVEVSNEVCDELDNDCDGEIDEDCDCVPGELRDCGSDIGICNAGNQYCVEGKWSICYGASYAASGDEVCNGVDDDCDGEVDEGCGCIQGNMQECGTNVGLCEIGEQTCEAGVWGECLGGVQSFAEVCSDEVDNDCDGKIDLDDENCGGGEVIESVEIDEEEIEVDTSVDYEDEEEEEEFENNIDLIEDSDGFGYYTLIIILVVLLVLGGLGYFLYKKGMFKKGKKKSSMKPVQKKSVQRPVQRPIQRMPSKKSLKRVINPLEDKLMSSFKKSSSLFKKK